MWPSKGHHINFGYPYRVYPCNDCHLIAFVSSKHQKDHVPCHFINLNEMGETLNSLELDRNESQLERILKDWLAASIDEIEEMRGNIAMAGCP